MSTSPNCGRCGALVEADAAFCKKCGLDVTQAYTPPPAPPASPSSVQASGSDDPAGHIPETIMMPKGDETIAMPQGAETVVAPATSLPTDATVVAGTPPPSATVAAGAVPGAAGPPPRVQATMRQQLRDATLGEYEILSELGRGGMATVFLAHDIALDRKVAIKVMAPHLLEGDGMVDRFKLEARTAAQLSHPHIIPIYAVKWTESTIYFVMKFIEGRPLDDIIKKMAPLPIPMVKDILIKVGGALGYGHRRDVVHRDIKPANIMIDEEGTPIVTDFGIAKVANEGGGLTMTGTTIGTPSYMSPEQCEAKEVSGASDQYSLGILAWEMLTGKLPFEGQSAVSTMYMHCHEPLPPLMDFRPDCPHEVVETVERMLAKDPKDRWPSLEAAIQKLGTDSTMSYMDPVHSELVELVKQGDHRELLARIQTPRSPIPVGRTGQTTAPGVAEPKRSKKGLAFAGFGIVAAAAAVLVLQPDLVGRLTGGGEVGNPTGTEQLPPPPPPTGADPVTVSSVEITDAPTSIDVGGRYLVRASVIGSDGNDMDEAVEWSSSNDAVIRMDGSEVVAVAPGTASISATVGDVFAQATVEVPTPQDSGGGETLPPPPVTVRSVQIVGAPTSIQVGDRRRISARVIGSNGADMQRQVRWTSSNADVVRMNGDEAVAVSPGDATISGAVDGVSARTTITVSAVPVTQVDVSNSEVEVTAGQAGARVRATARGATGQDLGRPIAWASEDERIATVDADGQIRGVAPGRTRVVASSGDRTASVDVVVLEAPLSAAERIIEEYAAALESRDINQVRRVHTGLSSDDEATLRNALPAMNNLQANLTIASFDLESDTRATALVTGSYVFDAGGRQEAPQSFTAVFERSGATWRLVSTRNQ